MSARRGGVGGKRVAIERGLRPACCSWPFRREIRELAAAYFGACRRPLGSGRRVVKDQGRILSVDTTRGTLSHGPVCGAANKQEQYSSSAGWESSCSVAHTHENAESGHTRRSPLSPGGSTGRLFPHAKRQHVCSCRSWDRWAFVFNLSMDPRCTFGSALSGSRKAPSAKDGLAVTTARRNLRSLVRTVSRPSRSAGIVRDGKGKRTAPPEAVGCTIDGG